MAFEPITRLEKILTGEKATPYTRLEKAVKIAVDNAGSGGDEYETVAEIAVGQMEAMEGTYFAITEVTFPTFSESEVYYLNTSDSPNDGFATNGDEVGGILWNCKEGEGESDPPVPLDPSKPYTAVLNSDRTTVIVADTPDLSNTTVRILKKVSGGGSITVDDELSGASENPVQNKVITAALEAAKPLIVHGTADIVKSTAEITDEISLGEIYTAAAAGRFVAFECSLDEGNATRLALAGYTLVGGEYAFTFTAPATQSNKPAVISVEFENSKDGTFEMAVAQ